MIKLFFLMMFLFIGPYPLKADQAIEADQGFMKELDSIKSPFEDGIPVPKPVVVPQQPVSQAVVGQPVVPRKKKSKHAHTQKVEQAKPPLPDLHLQGIIEGAGIEQAIINDQIVTLHSTIMGAKVIQINSRGVRLMIKGRKFTLRVD